MKLWIKAFAKREFGAVTVEFVVLVPLMISFIVFVAFVSLYLATASDVQQVTHDLARAALSRFNPHSGEDFCKTLETDLLAGLIDGARWLSAERFTLESCNDLPDADGLLRITASYDFAGTTLQSFGKILDVDLGIIQKSSSVYP